MHIAVRLELGTRSYAYEWRLYLREKTVRRLNKQRAPEQRLRFRKKTTLAQERLVALQQRLPPRFQVYVLFDSWYAANRLLKFCRHPRWHVVCAIKSNRKLDDQKLSQWPQALRHQRYQRVQLTATDQRQRTYLVRTLQGKLNTLPFEVCVLISQRRHRDKHPKYFLCTELSLSAQQILSIYQKRWPIEVKTSTSNSLWAWRIFAGNRMKPQKSGLLLSSLRSCFCNGACIRPMGRNDYIRWLMWCVSTAMNMHAPCWETACKETAKLSDSLPVVKRFLCQPT